MDKFQKIFSDINGIDDLKALWIQNLTGIVHELYPKTFNRGPIYSQNEIVRSLLLKFFNYSTSFIEQMFSTEDSDRIVFIVKFTQTEKYFLTFKFSTRDKTLQLEIIEKLKLANEQAITWFKEQCADSICEVGPRYTRIFPRYPVNNYRVKLKINNHTVFSELIDASLTGLRVSLADRVELSQTIPIEIEIGDHILSSNAFLVWHSELKNQHLGLALAFENLRNFNEWKVFVMALDKRQNQR